MKTRFLIPLALFLWATPALAQETSGGFTGGSVMIGYDNRACTSPLSGSVRYNSGSSCMEYCDGTAWFCPDPVGGGCTVTWDALTDVTNAAQSTLIESDIQLVTTSGCAGPVTIGGDGSPEYRICTTANCSSVAHAYSSAAGTIDSGEYIQARLTSGGAPAVASTATLTIGNAATAWTVTTANIPQYIDRTTFTASWPAPTTSNINKPAGTQSGDLLIAMVAIDESGVNIVPPVGWTELRDVNTATARTAVFYLIAGASEPSAYTFNFNSDEFRVGTMITVRNVHQTTPINVNATSVGDDNTQPSAPSITTTVPDTLLVAFVHATDGGTNTPPVGYTERSDVNISGRISGSVATKSQSASGATGAAVFTHSGTIYDWRTEHIAVRAP